MSFLAIASYLEQSGKMSFHIKQSHHLLPSQASHFIDGVVYAYRSGMPLTRTISFNCSILRIDSFVLAQRFSKLSSDWIRTKGATPAYAWIRENPSGGDNLHWLGHVPQPLGKHFAGMQKRWVKEAGARIRKKGIMGQKIGIRPGGKDRELTDVEYLANLDRWVGYLLKGCNEAVCDELGIDHEPQGPVWHRRVGLSENIGRKARADAGFKFKRIGAPIHPSRVNLDRIAAV